MVPQNSVVLGLLFGSVGWIWVLAMYYAYFSAVSALAGRGPSDGFSTIHELGFVVVSLLGLVVLSDVVVRTWRPAPLWFVIGIGAGAVAVTGLYVGYTVKTSDRGLGPAVAVAIATTLGFMATVGMVLAVICSYWFRFWG